jgi:hypothetical protein
VILSLYVIDLVKADLSENGQKFDVIFIDRAVALSDVFNLVAELAGIIGMTKALLEGRNEVLKG